MRNLKKALSLVLAMAMMLSVMVIGAGAAFTDNDKISDEYAVAVEFAAQTGILEGFENGTYGPQKSLTRAQLATMTYRIATGDVEDDYTADFAGGAAAAFTDTPATAWYAGYVGYAADAGYLKGVGEGLYKPNSVMTGYQALAAFLRAIGYNEPGQFTGADWTVQVAMVADQIGALEGIKGVDLNAAISREVAAQILYNILFSNMVEYTPAFGYQDLNGYYGTLAKNEFEIKTDKDGKDIITEPWGRPATIWENTKGKDVVTIDATPVATYTEKVSECDIALDLGLEKNADVYAEFLNGNSHNCFDGKINLTKTQATIGGQGTLTEVYEWGDGDYVVVMLEQFLAEVGKVTEVKYDVNGHVKTKATLALDVYTRDTATIGDAEDLLLKDSENFEYAEGDMMLVYYNGEDTVEFVDYADSIEGKQTKLTTKDSHVVDGTEYMDAARLHLDQAGIETGTHTWYFDTYGNLIGIVDVEAVYTYGTISAIRWIDSFGDEDGYAEATITYIDGSSEKAVVDTIILNNQERTEVELQGIEGKGVSYANGLVSTTKQYNKDAFTNRALYEISENKDGELILDPVVKLENATVKTGVTKLADGVSADANTMFLVWNGEDYETYTGIRNIPTYTVPCLVWYYDDADAGVEYVFVIDPYVEPEVTNELFFIDADDAIIETILKEDDTIDYYVLTDGDEISIKSEDKALLEGAIDKLFYLTVVDGFVTEAQFIGGTPVSVGEDLLAVRVGKLAEDMLNTDELLLTTTVGTFDIETPNFINAADWEEAMGKVIWVVYTSDADMEVVDVYVK